MAAHRSRASAHLGRFHLVVRDIGGWPGFELATTMLARIASLTLNTTVPAPGRASPK